MKVILLGHAQPRTCLAVYTFGRLHARLIARVCFRALTRQVVPPFVRLFACMLSEASACARASPRTCLLASPLGWLLARAVISPSARAHVRPLGAWPLARPDIRSLGCLCIRLLKNPSDQILARLVVVWPLACSVARSHSNSLA